MAGGQGGDCCDQSKDLVANIPKCTRKTTITNTDTT